MTKKKGPAPSKEKYVISHFKRRMMSRYSMKATEELVREIVRQIQTNQSVFVSRESNTRTRHRVTVANGNGEPVSVLVVYSSEFSRPVTALLEGESNGWSYE